MKFEIDAGQTALANAHRRMEMLRAEHPQTTWTDPVCRDEDPPWAPIREEWIKDEGMVKFLGPQQAKPCGHKAEDHLRGGVAISDTHPISGRRGKDGAFRLKMWTPPRPAKGLPKATLENIAACAALGLSYWSDASGTNKVWAVDADQNAHTVLIDRKVGKAEHYCGQSWRYDPTTQNMRANTRVECRDFTRIADWSVPATMGELFAVMDPPPAETDPLGATGHCKVGNHHRCAHRIGGPQHGGVTMSDGTVYRCACDCHTIEVPVDRDLPTPTEEEPMPTPTPRSDKIASRQAAARKAEKEAAIKKASQKATADARRRTGSVYDANREPDMSRETARALLLHDPDYLGDITNAALVDLLEDETVKKYHPRIRRELRVNRGLTERKSA